MSKEEKERALLTAEILTLEQAIIDTGRTNITFASDPSFFDEFSVPELRGMRNRFNTLARSLGGIGRVQ